MPSLLVILLHSFNVFIKSSGSVLQTHINLFQAAAEQNVCASAWLCILFPSGKGRKLNGNAVG